MKGCAFFSTLLLLLLPLSQVVSGKSHRPQTLYFIQLTSLLLLLWFRLDEFDNEYAQLDSDGINTVMPMTSPMPVKGGPPPPMVSPAMPPLDGGMGVLPPMMSPAMPPMVGGPGSLPPMPKPAGGAGGCFDAHGKLLPGPDPDSVVLETDDGFTTLRVSGSD